MSNNPEITGRTVPCQWCGTPVETCVVDAFVVTSEHVCRIEIS